MCWLPQTFMHTKGKYSNAGEKYHQNRDAMNLNLQLNNRIRKSCLTWWPMLLNPTLGRQRFQVIKNCTVKPCQRERDRQRDVEREGRRRKRGRGRNSITNFGQILVKSALGKQQQKKNRGYRKSADLQPVRFN